MYKTKRGEYRMNTGYYERIDSNPDGTVKKKKLKTAFLLGNNEQVAKDKFAAINLAWGNCKRRGSSLWLQDELQKLVSSGVIAEDVMVKICMSVPAKLAKALTNDSVMRRMTADEIETSDDFGNWLIFRFTSKLRTPEFVEAFDAAIDKLKIKNPFEAAKMALDFQRIIGEQKRYSPPQTNILNQITGFKFGDEIIEPHGKIDEKP